MNCTKTMTPGFCPSCGSILPHLKTAGNVVCYNCREEFTGEVFGTMSMEYTIMFNSSESMKKHKTANQNKDEGPIIDRKCIKCGNEKMSYATVQLRSADEGQTVFFTCTKCFHKESENS